MQSVNSLFEGKNEDVPDELKKQLQTTAQRREYVKYLLENDETLRVPPFYYKVYEPGNAPSVRIIRAIRRRLSALLMSLGRRRVSSSRGQLQRRSQPTSILFLMPWEQQRRRRNSRTRTHLLVPSLLRFKL